MSTIAKSMFIGALLVALAPVAYASQGGMHSKLHRQHTYGATVSHRAASALAQQRVGREQVGPVIKDDPPGSAWQTRGIIDESGYPAR